ncbi:mRNA decay activator protein ZFP36L2-like [Carcharodon carcharias]|uniref:mRNA decay activator protein ZFP36L2-like n=1 Tax=Carcharodon carcharias TaxID=13397 RepID=UPI001B7E82E1|nr:mRNA decay activator protein ZFP36L2-like [Carcharodon carcharias]
MSGLKELCELVSGLSFLDPDELSAFQAKLDSRAVKPPAGFRRHSTSFLPPGKCQALAPGDSSWPLAQSLGLSRCLSHGDSPEDFSKPAVQQQQQQQQPSPRYKTELCRPFQESGLCRYGDKCQFAHGLGELRILSRHPKYKTELCRTFHSTGLCPYGSRCHFIHNPEEEWASRLPLSARPRLRQSTSFSGFSSDRLGGLCPGSGGPLSLSPPPCTDLPDWDSLRSAVSQEFARVMKLTCCSCHKHLNPVSKPQADLSFRSPYADSLSDQEDYSSSGSESPVFDQNRRLPIFSRISVSDD